MHVQTWDNNRDFFFRLTLVGERNLKGYDCAALDGRKTGTDLQQLKKQKYVQRRKNENEAAAMMHNQEQGAAAAVLRKQANEPVAVLRQRKQDPQLRKQEGDLHLLGNETHIQRRNTEKGAAVLRN